MQHFTARQWNKKCECIVLVLVCVTQDTAMLCCGSSMWWDAQQLPVLFLADATECCDVRHHTDVVMYSQAQQYQNNKSPWNDKALFVTAHKS